MTAMLELIYDDAEGTHRVPINQTLTFGRSSDNDVVLRDFSVSRYHARIEVDEGVVRVTDLDSTNGVKINDTLVASGPLAAGDRLAIGSFTLLVEDSSDSQSGLSSATYLRPLSEFNEDYGLEGRAASVSSAGSSLPESSSSPQHQPQVASARVSAVIRKRYLIVLASSARVRAIENVPRERRRRYWRSPRIYRC